MGQLSVAEHQLKVLGVRRIDPRGGVVVFVVYGVDDHPTSGDVESLGVVLRIMVYLVMSSKKRYHPTKPSIS